MAYFVFRRNDNYVGSMCAESRADADVRTRTYRTPNGGVVSYEIIHETDDWDEAREVIVTEKKRLSCG